MLGDIRNIVPGLTIKETLKPIICLKRVQDYVAVCCLLSSFFEGMTVCGWKFQLMRQISKVLSVD